MKRDIRAAGSVTLVVLIAIVLLVATGVWKRAEASDGGVALPAPAEDSTPHAKSGTERAVLAGGCYWGVQDVFEHIKGVKSTTAGFSQGSSMAEKDEAGHPAESVQITFDPSKVSYGQLLRVFFSVAHDPTQLNRQGPDTGPQYRSAIFYSTDEQKHAAEAYIAQLSQTKLLPSPIVTQVVPLKEFRAVEPSQQNFADLHPDNPYIVINDAPKVERLQREFPELYKK